MNRKLKQGIGATAAAAVLLLSGCSDSSSEKVFEQQLRATRLAGSPADAITNLKEVEGFTCDEIRESTTWELILKGDAEPNNAWLVLALAFIACPGGVDAVLDELEKGNK